MRSTSLFGTLVILGTLGSPVYGLPLQDSSDQAQAQGSQGSVLPNRPTGARLPKRTDATTTQPSTRARVTGGLQARAQVGVDPEEYLSKLASYYSAYAEAPGTSLLAEMASYTANNAPSSTDAAYLSSAESMLSAATAGAGENAAALTSAIGSQFANLFGSGDEGSHDGKTMPAGVGTIENGITYLFCAKREYTPFANRVQSNWRCCAN